MLILNKLHDSEGNNNERLTYKKMPLRKMDVKGKGAF